MNPEKKRKLLIVEDEPVAAATTSAMLRYNGYDVVTAVTGTRGVESVRQDSSIELILMDIDLGPGMSGPDAAREILQFRDIPIVFLTSHSEREMVYKVKAITRYGYVIKNSGDFVLLSSIEMAFELFESHMKLKKTSEQLAESEKSIRRKLDSILMPDIDLRHLELADLIDKDALQSLIDKFYLLTGFGIGIIDLKGKVLVAAGWQDICLNFHRAHPETREYCIESDTVLSSGVREGEYKLYKCKNNLWDIATPIMIDGRHVGNIFLGQFFFDDEVPDEEFFKARAELYGFDEGEYLSALRRVPRWKRGDVYNVMDYYTGLAEIIKKLSFGNIRLARALAERDRINETLAERNGLLSLITDNMSDLIFIIDKDGIYSYVSPSFFRILGYSPSDLEGRSAFEYVHDDDLDAIKSAMSVLFRDGVVKAESRYSDRRGNYSWYEISANVIRDSDGRITGAVVVGRDISERKEAYQLLHEHEEKFSRAFYGSPVLMSISEIETGRYIEINDCFCSTLGYAKDEVVGRTSIELGILSSEDRASLKEGLERTGSVRGKILLIRKKNGESIYCSFNGEIVTIGGGKKFLTIAENITARIEAEHQLKESEEMFSMAFESGPLIMALSEFDTGIYIEVNQNFSRCTGYTREDAVGKSSVDIGLIRQDERKRIIEAISATGNVINLELTLYKKNGDEMQCLFSGATISISGRKMLLSIVQDITDQKKTERKLEQSNKLYRMLMDNIPLSVFLVRNGKYIFANPAAAARLGYSSPEEIKGINVEDTIMPEFLEIIRERIRNADAGGYNNAIELPLKKRDGATITTESSSLHVNLDDGPAIMVIGKDITLEREMQRELRASEYKYRTVADNTYDWEFWINGEGELLYISPSCEELSGFSAAEFREDPELMSRIVYEEDRNSPCLLPGSVSEDPPKNEAEFRIMTKSGETKWIAHACRAVYDREGKFAGRRGSNRDITRRHEMEQELYKTYDRVESLWNISTLINVDFKTICDNILEAITRITESPYGFYGFINEDETAMTIHSWSGLAMADCSMADKPGEFILSDCGVWAEAVRQRGDLIINDYGKEHQAKKGYPEGHVELQRLMVIPLIKEGRVIAVAAVANKSEEYTGHDALLVKTFIGNAQAIIDRKKADDEIKSLLEQKEMLLREVHHRIKNNMNTVAGLLKLQSLSINEPAAVSALNDARSRVQNMMLIYDKLYRSADYKNLNVRDYFDNLLGGIVKIFPGHERVKLNMDVENFTLDSKVLFTMGIMVNELITNSFKYAFDGVTSPEINFSLWKDDSGIVFTVRDNGTGLPAGVLTGEREGFGLNLVSSLAEQLDGGMKIGEGPGTEITVFFMT